MRIQYFAVILRRAYKLYLCANMMSFE